MNTEKLKEIISCISYAYKDIGKISIKKLFFTIYLCDWKSAIDKGIQITDIKWKFLSEEFISSMLISSIEPSRIGNDSYMFSNNYEYLSEEEEKIINLISKLSVSLNTEEFIKLVFSTYPMMKGDYETDYFNLSNLAKDYKENYSYVGS